jgi:GNAT superfamily N-acetyltransferase
VEVNGRIVSHAGVASVRFRCSGEVVRGGMSVGAMTAPEMRGRGLFVRLGRYLYERMAQEGFAFVAGFSNRHSHRLMTGPLGRTALRPLPWCVRPVLPWRRKRGGDLHPGGNVRLAPCEPHDPRLDALWQAAAPTIRVGAVRDAAFSAWRYGTRPEAEYRMWMAGAAGRAEAYAVIRLLRIRGLLAGFLGDFLVDPAAPEAGDMLLRAVACEVASRGGRLLSALLPPTGPARRVLRRAGFVRVPEPFHPQVIRYSVRALGAYSERKELVDPSAWFLTWSDSDVV